MKHLTLSILLAMASLATSADWVMVAAAGSGVDAVSKADLKRIYTGRKASIGSSKVVPIMIAESSPAAAAFLKDVLGMSVDEYKKFWIDAQIKGQGTAPMIQKSSAGAVAVVGELPGAIAVVEPGAVDASVKALKIE
ncbi:MAG: hypothetical protein H6686_00245 [Fibrobacteria bacterium]|nr:hypothetical protein [Fibrobacteria bacterium]